MKKVGYKGRRRKILKVSIIVLVIIGILVVGFFVLRNMQANRDVIVFTNGVQYGYTQSIVQLMNMSLSCNPVPLYAGNVTIEMIAVDCLQMQQ